MRARGRAGAPDDAASFAPRLVDMHCHLDLMANGPEVARDAAARGIALFDATVTPLGAERAAERYEASPSVRVAAGLHPWWIADGTCGERDIEMTVLAACGARYVGEIGLDLGPRGAGSRAVQVEALDWILSACAERPVEGRVITIHAVRAASEVLDLIERYDLGRQATCIFHWFSGSDDELVRARRLGCRFSMGERMLRTRRGAAYARALPLDRLLLETDAPPEPGSRYSADELEGSLGRALDLMAAARGENRDELATALAAASAELLGMRPPVGDAAPSPAGTGR